MAWTSLFSPRGFLVVGVGAAWLTYMVSRAVGWPTAPNCFIFLWFTAFSHIVLDFVVLFCGVWGSCQFCSFFFSISGVLIGCSGGSHEVMATLKVLCYNIRGLSSQFKRGNLWLELQRLGHRYYCCRRLISAPNLCLDFPHTFTANGFSVTPPRLLLWPFTGTVPL